MYTYYIYLDSPTTLNFWDLSRKMAVFYESTFFEIKYCFLHVSDVHSWRYSWNCGNQINVPHCQLATHCCRCHFVLATWRCRSKDFQSIGSRLRVWCHGFDLPCFYFWTRFALSLLHAWGYRSQHSVADMRVHCSILVSTCPWKICPYNANPQRPFFLQTYLFFAEGRPDRIRKYGKMRPKYGNIRPVWTRPNEKDFFLKKRTFFFTSVRPSVKTVSAAGTTRSGRVDVLKPRVCSA